MSACKYGSRNSGFWLSLCTLILLLQVFSLVDNKDIEYFSYDIDFKVIF